jgi:light-regulated signal transduction histidine kinase (bacteriophytochrome)
MARSAMEPTPLDMAALAKSAYSEVRQQDGDRRIELHAGELPRASGDPAMLRQVWLNLLSNAVKYTRTREPAFIEIGGRVDGPEVVYSVRDNGVGFDMRYSDKLFGVFQRLHAPSEFEGTGVGLALVQRIVHRHGGRVWAASKPNEGATFYFTLPRQGDGNA